MNFDFDAGAGELKHGYVRENDVYRCLFCSREYSPGDIYSFGERLVDAKTAARLHIREEHGSVFDVLIAQDKKITGLTEVQNELLSLFYTGLSDKEIAAKTGTSPSTVRYQRFNLREKARQAKVFLALFELMEDRAKETKINIHKGATTVDERYLITEEETEKILKTFFTSLNPPVLKAFPPKEKKKLAILRVIYGQFEKERKYSEKEVNEILKAIYGDYVTIRRYLIEYGFMERTNNCEEYRLK